MQQISFDSVLPKEIVDLKRKTRSNNFSWRGQFSPQLVEILISTYAKEGDLILDPFSGSGTVLYESAQLGHESYGVELNPAAFTLSKVYELCNLSSETILKLNSYASKKIFELFPEPEIFTFDEGIVSFKRLQEATLYLQKEEDQHLLILFNAFIILLNTDEKPTTCHKIHATWKKLSNIVKSLELSRNKITPFLGDARRISLESDVIDFIITSPPYINVFNYHQNYRKSAELLGWNLLKVSRSEIGSNRANRGNRYLTVIQYCLDMSLVLAEIHRVCKKKAKIILVVGFESKVLGVPFYNADIITQIALRSKYFSLIQTQHRTFKNKFGKEIREDIIHLVVKGEEASIETLVNVARAISLEALKKGLEEVSDKNRPLLNAAISRVPITPPTNLIEWS